RGTPSPPGWGGGGVLEEWRDRAIARIASGDQSFERLASDQSRRQSLYEASRKSRWLSVETNSLEPSREESPHSKSPLRADSLGPHGFLRTRSTSAKRLTRRDTTGPKRPRAQSSRNLSDSRGSGHGSISPRGARAPAGSASPPGDGGDGSSRAVLPSAALLASFADCQSLKKAREAALIVSFADRQSLEKAREYIGNLNAA
ncbi:hypothetical protein T484DRAFT_1808558, partial [Baffinella frigidus]